VFLKVPPLSGGWVPPSVQAETLRLGVPTALQNR
jgi:hypothetical protein